MNNCVPLETWDSDNIVEQLLSEYDDTSMPLPDMVSEGHLLISKVRKHYMEYIIKLLSINYENNQKLLNKNIYLPSAIWRCAKNIEINAAQASMVVQLYRKNIIAVIKELKNDTMKGKLYKKLYQCLHNAPQNEKKSQTTLAVNNCNCQCTCNQRKKRRKVSTSPKMFGNEQSSLNKNINSCNEQLSTSINTECSETIFGEPLIRTEPNITNETSASPRNFTRVASESDSHSDELMLQLEKLFQSDDNDDDLFEGTLCDTVNSSNIDDNVKKSNSICIEAHDMIQKQEHHATQIKSLDERLSSLDSLLVNNNENVTCEQKIDNKIKKHHSSKWLCEEYFLKLRFFELLDQIRDCNRKKLVRIKKILTDLFGDDSDDDGVLSPLDETPEFIISCKERIAPWVVKLLTPHYIKGRIRGKALFKALAKHLIKLIFQCSQYPHEYEVCSFVSDFLHNHKMIRCEADFKEFRIENI